MAQPAKNRPITVLERSTEVGSETPCSTSASLQQEAVVQREKDPQATISSQQEIGVENDLSRVSTESVPHTSPIHISSSPPESMIVKDVEGLDQPTIKTTPSAPNEQLDLGQSGCEGPNTSTFTDDSALRADGGLIDNPYLFFSALFSDKIIEETADDSEMLDEFMDTSASPPRTSPYVPFGNLSVPRTAGKDSSSIAPETSAGQVGPISLD